MQRIHEYGSSHAEKVRADHLSRDAYLYVRQSSLRQVYEHGESTQRQYALRDRAVALGWPSDRIIVIDNDLGQSGASSAEREGFQQLVAEVGMGRAGLVMGLEVSRLARNSSDWHRLLEICALTDTLILDEDGLYDVSHFNDRLLLGLKGTMSEAELHFLKARMRGGALNKARRGELKMELPVGFLYNDRDEVILDPDRQVQASIRRFFETFRHTGSALATVKAFRKEEVLFPRRVWRGFRKGELHWVLLTHQCAVRVLHNPRYAGAFFYGRTRSRKQADGRLQTTKLPRDKWITLIPDAHQGYISWEEFEENQRRLSENAQGYGNDRGRRTPGDGPALLQGLAICGRCGRRMSVRYHSRRGKSIPDYWCSSNLSRNGGSLCQRIPGQYLDDAIAKLILEAMTPVSIEVALSVQEELLSRAEEADRLRAEQVERARYEAELARRRYLNVDPENRLVADALEADWNQRLRVLNEAEQTYMRQREQDHLLVRDELRDELLSLATDFPGLWSNPRTSDRDRKRIVRLILEDVTLRRDAALTLEIRFRGGATQTLTLPLPKNAPEGRRTDPRVITAIDRLLDDHLESEIAVILNQQGLRSGEGLPFTKDRVQFVRTVYGLKSRFERLRERGLLTIEEMSEALQVTKQTIRLWRKHGLVKGYPFDGRNECLYEPLAENPPKKMLGRKLAQRLPTNRAHV